MATYRDVQFDLVLTDIVMPGMTGPELVEALRAASPSLKIIYMSGYDPNTVELSTIIESAEFLPKPFTPATLLFSVRKAFGLEQAEQEVDPNCSAA